MLAAQSPTPATPADEVRLTQENRAAIRCSAAFAIIAHLQSTGDESARKWPDLGPRGREFFVVALAQVMDQTGLDRNGVAQLVGDEARRLRDEGAVDAVMPACLVMLEASGV
ncbi:hypothetical protein KDC96_10605 [Erythrobacter sp. JK5]|nr:hypothetical protein KDC96_10605 [Erythrobacter sp. JK5]